MPTPYCSKKDPTQYGVRMGGATIGPGGDMTPPLSDAGGDRGDIIWE